MRDCCNCNDKGTYRRSQDFLWVHFFLKKLMTFLDVVVNTQAKTTTLTTPHSFNPDPAQRKLKIDFFLRMGVHLQLTPINYARKKSNFLALGVHLHPLHPGYAHEKGIHNIQNVHFRYSSSFGCFVASVFYSISYAYSLV